MKWNSAHQPQPAPHSPDPARLAWTPDRPDVLFHRDAAQQVSAENREAARMEPRLLDSAWRLVRS